MKYLERIRSRIIFEFSKWVRPQMIQGFRRADGTVCANTRISNTTFIDHKDRLLVGDHVFIGHYNYIEASGGLTLEEGCQITNFVSITTHSSHISIRLYGSALSQYPKPVGYVQGPVFIGRYSFIGPHSLIMPNTHIGMGSIVSAYSLVKGVFPDYAVLSGNPAVVVGDTRNIDQPFLDKHPELLAYYRTWQS